MTSPHTHRLGALALIAAAMLPLTACAQTSDSSEEASASESATLANPAIISDGKLTVCAALLSPPNVFTDEQSGEAVGVEVDIAQALADELGLELQSHEVAFPGLIPALQAKQCDTIMSSLYIKPEREEVVDFVPYLISGSALVAQPGNPKNITGYDDSLCGLRIVVQTGSTGATLIEERSDECVASGEPAVIITQTDSPGTAFQQVLADQQDAHITTAESAAYYDTLGDFSSVGAPFGQVDIGAATLKDNQELRDALQAALDAIIENGTYEKVLDEWGAGIGSVAEQPAS